MTLVSDRSIPSLGERERSVDSIPSTLSNPLSRLKSLDVSVRAPGLFSWQGSAQFIKLPSPDGEFGILPGHCSLTTFLDVGVLRIRVKDDRVLSLVVLGGFAQVAENQVKILAAGAERADGLELRQTFADVEAAEADLNQAQSSSAKREAKKNLKRAYARRQAASCL
jgi:F-type H+-transporting ATPase subunit epsilon